MQGNGWRMRAASRRAEIRDTAPVAQIRGSACVRTSETRCVEEMLVVQRDVVDLID
jgi:hypothetical protein